MQGSQQLIRPNPGPTFLQLLPQKLGSHSFEVAAESPQVKPGLDTADKLTAIEVFLKQNSSATSTRQSFRFDFVTGFSQSDRRTVCFKLRDAAYLFAWLKLDGVATRFPSHDLGLLKATSYASLLTGKELSAFKSVGEAYAFFKAELPPASMRTLLGENEEELAARIEAGNLTGLGGYLGGLTESKDKTQFKAAVTKLLPAKLAMQLIPQPVLNEKGKRIKNKFQFAAPHYIIK